MSLLTAPVTESAGLSGVHPNWIYIPTNNTLAEVSVAGFLNNPFTTTSDYNSFQVALVSTTDNGVVTMKVSVAGDGIITLTAFTMPSLTTLNVGSDGVAGTLNIWPTTASKGKRTLVAADNAANYTITETNASFGQSTTVTMPDPGTATALDVISPAALVNNNLVKASGVAGLVADAGVAVSNLQLKTQIKAVNVSWAGGGTSHAFAVTGATSSSVITVSIVSEVNPAYILTAAPGTNIVTVTFNTDPGAVVINAIAFIVAQ